MLPTEDIDRLEGCQRIWSTVSDTSANKVYNNLQLAPLRHFLQTTYDQIVCVVLVHAKSIIVCGGEASANLMRKTLPHNAREIDVQPGAEDDAEETPSIDLLDFEECLENEHFLERRL